MAKEPLLLFSCEHGGNNIPPKFRRLFSGRGQTDLSSHKGCDWGALAMARHFARIFKARLFFTEISRLLIDCNRSPHHLNLFSNYTNDLSPDLKEEIKQSYYFPYRNDVETFVRKNTKGRPLLHISVHSFTPALNGETRNAEVGLLYNPSRKGERRFCTEWQATMENVDDTIRVRRNYPYRGAADGLTTHLRRLVGPDRYIGVELELNQKLVGKFHQQAHPKLAAFLVQTLARTVNCFPFRK